jgi:hypothetical protein
VLALFALPTSARADDPSDVPKDELAFGHKHVVVVDNDFGAGLIYQVASFRGSSTSAVKIAINPSFLYFVAPHVAIGGVLLYQMTKPEDGDSATASAIGPAVGFEAPVGPKVSFFPRLSLAYATTSSGDITVKQTIGAISMPLLFHLVPHLFLGAGPSVSHSFTSRVSGQDGPTLTNVDVTLLLGGWF